MEVTERNLLLADDDRDDGIFFKEALAELPVHTHLTIVNDGVQLMELLKTSVRNLPDLLFLDLNMPLKSGAECLSEIKLIDELSRLPVIIFSTSMDTKVINSLYEKGALYYIRKPGDFLKLKKVIHEALNITAHNDFSKPPIDKFILQP
jgi:CheY-like chemotaxis protein